MGARSSGFTILHECTISLRTAKETKKERLRWRKKVVWRRMLLVTEAIFTGIESEYLLVNSGYSGGSN